MLAAMELDRPIRGRGHANRRIGRAGIVAGHILEGETGAGGDFTQDELGKRLVIAVGRLAAQKFQLFAGKKMRQPAEAAKVDVRAAIPFVGGAEIGVDGRIAVALLFVGRLQRREHVGGRRRRCDRSAEQRLDDRGFQRRAGQFVILLHALQHRREGRNAAHLRNIALVDMRDARAVGGIARRDLDHLAGIDNRLGQPETIGHRQAVTIDADALEQIDAVGLLRQPIGRDQLHLGARRGLRPRNERIFRNPFAGAEIGAQRGGGLNMDVPQPGGVAFQRVVRPGLPAALGLARPVGGKFLRPAQRLVIRLEGEPQLGPHDRRHAATDDSGDPAGILDHVDGAGRRAPIGGAHVVAGVAQNRMPAEERRGPLAAHILRGGLRLAEQGAEVVRAEQFALRRRKRFHLLWNRSAQVAKRLDPDAGAGAAFGGSGVWTGAASTFASSGAKRSRAAFSGLCRSARISDQRIGA